MHENKFKNLKLIKKKKKSKKGSYKIYLKKLKFNKNVKINIQAVTLGTN